MFQRRPRREALVERTRQHYNHYPFEFMGSGRVDARRIQPPPMLEFADRYLTPTQRILDVGCGPGRVLVFLEELGARPIGCDLSEESLRVSRPRTAQTTYVQANCLSLPFSAGSFDVVVCDGVLHHTPDAEQGIREAARILKPRGLMYLGLYKRWRYYYYLYRYAGAPIRALARSRAGRAVIDGVLLPPYELWHTSRGTIVKSRDAARNFFYDYFVTPQATFHSRRQVVRWGRGCGLVLLSYEPYPGSNCHVFVFRKGHDVAGA